MMNYRWHMQSMARVTVPGSGVRMIADVVGQPDDPTLLFLHGSGQTRQSWGRALEQAAGRGYRAFSFDLRGHGDSDWSPDGKYTLDRFSADLREAIDHIGGSKPIIVGASLGGIVGMMIAASPPPMLGGLVLVDITPRVEQDGAKEVTAFMDSAPNGFASLEEAADAVSAYLPHRPRPKDTSGLKRNLRLRDGRYFWHWDPAMVHMGKDAKFDGPNPLAQIAGAIKIPTLLVRGSRSRIVSEEGVREFLDLVPHAEYVDISDAHHMVAGDANDAFNDAVFAFVEKQTWSGSTRAEPASPRADQ
jgi:pimeloyl-ACP methyl ester carboxylesterase